MPGLALADLLELHAVKNVAKLLARRWGLGMGFVPAGGVGAEPPRPRGRGLCALAQSRDAGDVLCSANAATLRTPCWAGLREIAVPVGALGTLLAGGFVFADEGEATLEVAEERIVALGVVADGHARASHPRLAPSEVGVVEELLRLAAEEVVYAHAAAPPRRPSTRPSYDAIIGSSVPMQELYALLDKISDSDSTVLIQGENGTGKELIAKAIHHNSPRKDRRFLVQNCSAFNDNLLDSELFGHKKGAFTGAIADKIGLFEAADGGTFFLDEIGDMSPALQVKVLRVLQEGTFLPVGDTTTHHVDVRIIAATNRDLGAMVASGEFREDLYYRINVINLGIPPLRERKADLPILVDHFLKKHSRGRRAGRKLTRDCLMRLEGYHWPGNVRELENEIERLIVLSGEERAIGEELLSPRIRQAAPGAGAPERRLGIAVGELERRMIADALRRHHGNKTRAARELQVSRRNLIRLVQKYQLDSA